jgi:hypothetical protein
LGLSILVCAIQVCTTYGESFATQGRGNASTDASLTDEILINEKNLSIVNDSDTCREVNILFAPYSLNLST